MDGNKLGISDVGPKIKEKVDFRQICEQLVVENPNFAEQRIFWAQNGNSPYLMCTLCNIKVPKTYAYSVKNTILHHGESKKHKRNVVKYYSQDNNEDSSCSKPSNGQCIAENRLPGKSKNKIRRRRGLENKITLSSELENKIKTYIKRYLTLSKETEGIVCHLEALRSDKQQSSSDGGNTAEDIDTTGDGVSTTDLGPQMSNSVDCNLICEKFAIENPKLAEHKIFWLQKGGNPFFICVLCDSFLPRTYDVNCLKNAMELHIESKTHKREYANYQVQRSSKGSPYSNPSDEHNIAKNTTIINKLEIQGLPLITNGSVDNHEPQRSGEVSSYFNPSDEHDIAENTSIISKLEIQDLPSITNESKDNYEAQRSNEVSSYFNPSDEHNIDEYSSKLEKQPTQESEEKVCGRDLLIIDSEQNLKLRHENIAQEVNTIYNNVEKTNPVDESRGGLSTNYMKVKKKKKVEICLNYEQLVEETPIIAANKMSWVQNGNSPYFICTPCNAKVPVPRNAKFSLMSHIEGKKHKRKIANYNAQRSNEIRISSYSNPSDEHCIAENTSKLEEQGVPELSKESEETICSKDIRRIDSQQSSNLKQENIPEKVDTINNNVKKTNPMDQSGDGLNTSNLGLQITQYIQICEKIAVENPRLAQHTIVWSRNGNNPCFVCGLCNKCFSPRIYKVKKMETSLKNEMQQHIKSKTHNKKFGKYNARGSNVVSSYCNPSGEHCIAEYSSKYEKQGIPICDRDILGIDSQLSSKLRHGKLDTIYNSVQKTNSMENSRDGLSTINLRPEKLRKYLQMCDVFATTNPELAKHKIFWLRNDNNPNFKCTLCDTFLVRAYKVEILKNVLEQHIKTKKHVQKFSKYQAQVRNEVSSHCKTSDEHFPKLAKESKEKMCVRDIQKIDSQQSSKLRHGNIAERVDTIYNRVEKTNPADGSSDGISTNGDNRKGKNDEMLDFNAFYEQLQKESPMLEAHKMFWAARRIKDKYKCDLCNKSVHIATPILISIFRNKIMSHIESSHHKELFEIYKSQEIKDKHIVRRLYKSQKTMSKDNLLCKKYPNSEVDECKVAGKTSKTKKKKISNVDALKNNSSEKWHHENIYDQLVDFDAVYKSFEKDNPVVKSSKQFLIKHSDGRQYICTLCDELIVNSLNANEFRYNLWEHLNEESHREKLPNFDEVRKEFIKTIEDLSKILPRNLTDDVKYFEIGPVFRFLKCSLCDTAISSNIYRLENHIKSRDHKENKNMISNGKYKKEPSSNCMRDAFRKLVVQIDDQFKQDIKYVRIGKIPGYVICSLCTHVVLSTDFYLETHFKSSVHKNNKSFSIVNKNSKFKVRLEDLMKTLPKDLQDYDIFEENMSGLTCKRCKESVPATSYDLYTHINKEKNLYTQ